MTTDDERSPRAPGRPGGRSSRRGRLPTTTRAPAVVRPVKPALIAVSAVLTAVLFITAVARGWGLEWGPLMVAVAATPYVILAGLLGAALAAVARVWVLAGSALAVSLLLALTQVPLFVPSPDGDSKEHAMTVMTVNMGFGEGDVEAVMRAVRESKVTLLAVQELTPEAAERLIQAGVQEQLPHRFLEAAPGVHGGGLWSKYPLSETRVLPGFQSRHLVARVAADDPAPVNLTVALVHPVAPSLFRRGVNDEEHRRLRSELAGLPGSVIALGDFNATYDNIAMRNLRKDKFRNAVEAAGEGFKPTFGPRLTRVPLFGIDHVLLRGPLSARSASTVRVPGSRHRALVVELVR